jgi:outer membrane protein OmpA-like peptidoglycan-associated protein
VHDDALAAQSADTVNALAYTSGQDIVFGAGQFAPDTVKGRELLMHEAAHVVEHRSTGGRAAREGARSPAISRAPKPGTADPPSLFAASIPAPSMIQVGSSMLVTIYFGHNNFLLDTRNFEAVTQLQEKLRFMFKPDVNVDGFASGEGTPANNLRLSDMRRQSVIAILRQASKDLQFGGTAHGASDPVEQETATVPAELEQQRARNRRVTIFIIGSSAPAKPEEKKPIKIFSPRLKDLPEETDSERLDRLLKERSRLPSLKRPKISLSDKFWENVDDTVDRVTKKITNNKKIRELIKDGVHKAIEKGSEEILDRALDETSLDKSAKEAIKSGLKAGIKFEF